MTSRDTRPGKQFVNNANQPAPELYTHAAATDSCNRLIFTSGHWGMRNGQFGSSAKEQVDDSFKNLQEALEASGAGLDDIVKLTFYIVGWPWTETEALVEPWVKRISNALSHKPPTTVIPVSNLASPDAKFEVEAVASIGGRARPWNVNPQSQPQAEQIIKVDAVVVGAGFSGTQAAHDLSSAGLSVVLLEATHRVGGRSKTKSLASGPGVVELGATWINQYTQPKIYNTVKRLGLHPVKQYLGGDAVLQLMDGTLFRFGSGEGPGVCFLPAFSSS